MVFGRYLMNNYKSKNCERCGEQYTPANGRQKYCKECIPVVFKERQGKASKKYRKNHKEKLNQASKLWRETHKQWYENNYEKIKEYSKQWYKNHCEEIKQKSKQWKNENRAKVNQWGKQWRENHPEIAKQRIKKWCQAHPDEVKQRAKIWRETHKEEAKQGIYLWQKENPDKYKQIYKRAKAKRRALGFNPLNECFEGSEGHHVDKERVIYMPKDLHESISHSVLQNRNMEKINTVAFGYLNRNINTQMEGTSNV